MKHTHWSLVIGQYMATDMNHTPSFRILSSADVRQALPMKAAIEGMKQAFAQLTAGTADVPLRTRLPIPNQDGVAIFMPAYAAQSNALAVKIVSVFPHNSERKPSLPMIHAAVLVLDEATGRPVAMLEGATLTAIRTGAGGGASADLLARPDSHILGLLGAGVQARAGLEAVCTVRPIELVRVYSTNRAHVQALVDEMAGRGPVPRHIEVVDSPRAAVQGADIVYTATTSAVPTFDGRDLAPGAHVIGVGSYTPTMQEVDVTTIKQALVVVDSRQSAWAEAGELIMARDQGAIRESHIHAELGEIVLGQKHGRLFREQITFFKSVGVAVQDAVAASMALRTAETLGLGTAVAF